MIFDGKSFAAVKEVELKLKACGFERQFGRKPKLVTILNPEDRPSVVYTNIKAKMAERIGVEFIQIPINKFQITDNMQINNLRLQILEMNNDDAVDGIMVQQPLVGYREIDQNLCNLISPHKDVDGLNEKSNFLPATVRAVMEITNLQAGLADDRFSTFSQIPKDKLLICVVGNLGLVGYKLERELRKNSKYSVIGIDKDNFQTENIKRADVVISATGQSGLIKPYMLKNGVVAIDVGFPKGDFVPEVRDIAEFVTPVPGGVGPVTVAMLFDNLLNTPGLV